jgi:hypothetical protein
VRGAEVRLSVHLMVRDGAAVVERMLRPLRGVADELCFVDTGSVDGTPDLLARLAASLGIACRGVAVSPLSRPDLYFPDLPSSFRRSLPCEFSGLPLLRDWSAARNLGLELCSGDFVMKLDADDEVLEPANLPPTLAYLGTRPEVDVVMCPYEVCGDDGEVDHVEMYSRLWRRRPEICFREICHENVDWWRRALPSGAPNWIMAQQGLSFRDHRDNRSPGARAACRNLKVLLREYERLEAEGSPPTAHLCMYLAQEAAIVAPDLALEVLAERVEGLALCPADAAWYQFTLAECCSARGEDVLALDHYEASVASGSRRASLRRALLLRKLGLEWRAALVAAVAANRGCYYPQGAALSEIWVAELVIAQCLDVQCLRALPDTTHHPDRVCWRTLPQGEWCSPCLDSSELLGEQLRESVAPAPPPADARELLRSNH